MRSIQPPEHEPTDADRPVITENDWGEQGIVFCEYGNTEGWLKAPEEDLVSVER